MDSCTCCKREVPEARSCTVQALKIGGRYYERILFGREQDRFLLQRSERCRECGVGRGGYHHPGCSSEECPLCHGDVSQCRCRATFPERW